MDSTSTSSTNYMAKIINKGAKGPKGRRSSHDKQTGKYLKQRERTEANRLRRQAKLFKEKTPRKEGSFLN